MTTKTQINGYALDHGTMYVIVTEDGAFTGRYVESFLRERGTYHLFALVARDDWSEVVGNVGVYDADVRAIDLLDPFRVAVA